jgi:hypothetical protein
MKVLFVAGKFGDDDEGGRPSGYAERLIEAVVSHTGWNECIVYNGGKFDTLKSIDFKQFNVIFWCPDISNDKPKLVRDIKNQHPHCILITSKRNEKQKYGVMHLIAGALITKSNLLMEFNWINDFQVGATILDPLGNCFGEKITSIPELADRLVKRIEELRNFTRVPSVSIGETSYPLVPYPEPTSIESREIKSRKQFFILAQQYAEKFHQLIQVQTDRFLGNLSFRCAEGFPSFRTGEIIFVSKRNIDKRNIHDGGFVAVKAEVEDLTSRYLDSYKTISEKILRPVQYYGQDKPSVDTPIQLALYRQYSRIKYMLHSHTYVADAPMTKSVVPCGALEEVAEIEKLVPSKDCNWFFVNLRGHGSLCAAENSDMLANIPYIARPVPEMQC